MTRQEQEFAICQVYTGHGMVTKLKSMSDEAVHSMYTRLLSAGKFKKGSK